MKKLLAPLVISSGLVMSPAWAGTETEAVVEPPSALEPSAGDWCAPLKESLGLKYAGHEPWLWDLGANYYLCDDYLKVMGGVQYDDISSGGDDVYEGWTSFLAVRMYF